MDPVILGLDPLMWTHVKLFIKDVIELVELPDCTDIYCFEDHNIRNVELCGIIVAVEQTLTMLIYTLDDGTGTIVCTWWKDSIDTEEMISLGSCVRIFGLVTTFKENRQIKVYELDLITDPNWELIHALQVMALRRSNYQKTYDISSKVKQHIGTLKQEMKTKKVVPSITSHNPHLNRKQVFQQTLLELASIKYGTTTSFTLKEFTSDDDMYDLADQHIRQVTTEQPARRMVENLISDIFNASEKEGYIIKTDDDRYKLFDDYDMEQEVLDIIRSSVNTSGKLGGVNHQYISTMIQHKYERQAKSVINNCINNMVEKSIIYKTDPGRGFATCDYMILED
ncbi:hypothetical protein BC941DRAFT_422669 [Chlamydoabsidia padenii]|nr:hypothetical protein BC941DRAFT_422669 [Chlamydoabsidia padenii]